MRAPLVVLVLLTGCPTSHNSDCSIDADCGGGDVCARDGECLPAADVYPVKVTWTIRSMPASATTCASAPDFYINFSGFSVQTFGFAPVPCDQGQFFVDKMPRGYNEVELGADGHFDKNTAITIGTGTTGTATFDLFL
jgi:hypothetical protein